MASHRGVDWPITVSDVYMNNLPLQIIDGVLVQYADDASYSDLL